MRLIGIAGARGDLGQGEARMAAQQVDGAIQSALAQVFARRTAIATTERAREREHRDERGRDHDEQDVVAPVGPFGPEMLEREPVEAELAELVEEFLMSPNTARQWVNAWNHVRGLHVRTELPVTADFDAARSLAPTL